MPKRKSSGIFRRYYFITSLIIFISFLIMLVTLLTVVSQYWSSQKTQLLQTNVSSVSSTAQQVMSSGQDEKIISLLLANSIRQISQSINADMFIVDTTGEVIYCPEMLMNSMVLFTGDCIIHQRYHISESYMERVLQNGALNETTTMDGLFEARHFVVAQVIESERGPVGAVFATQEMTTEFRAYVVNMLQMFAFAAIIALCIAFVSIYIMTYQMVQPLQEMAKAAKQYAQGDFSNRIKVWGKPAKGDDELFELIESFNSMASALATLESTRRSFVANVSHELKTPMTTIGGFIDGILDGTIEGDKQTQYLKIVSAEVKRLSRLVTSMLDLSKIEAGEMKIKAQRFDISQMIFEIFVNFEQPLEKKRVEVEGFAQLESIYVSADRDMINQVLYNLIDNAVKFVDEGGCIEVQVKKEDGQIKVSIANTGEGVSPEEISNIFERFYKVDKSRSENVRGTGLGLYIVKSIVELHGGKITAGSVENEFTSFCVSLPDVPESGAKQ